MSQLRSQLTEDMKNAMRAKDSMRLNTVRFIMSAVRNWEIDNGEPTDQDILKLIAKEVKQMKDANAEFSKGGREDLVEEENKKIAILEEYLPQQLSEAELEAAVKEVKAELGDADFGTTMRAVMAKVQGKADGAAVSAMVKKLSNG